ncbi:MAG: NADH-quinone oxidoreductase subunit C [Ekhidna sp.]|uniref:NADH-quinone oxidoreductase subunit C n=1 Tax=Ekhidna sp. TaxID=2608089 RepID=UPI0032F00A22
MQFEEIKKLIEQELPSAVIGEDLESTPKALLIHPSEIKEVCTFIHAHEKTYFDSLSCLTVLDNGEEKNTMEVIYNLYSIPYDLHLALKVELDRNKPEIESVTAIWRAADWHEREAYDLLGIQFNNHPDPRRILLPDDWVGHPLRKDYVEQETYHEVKVKY